MKHSEIIVGNVYALRLPVEGVPEDLWPLTRAKVVSATSSRARPSYEVEVASYRATNLHDIPPEHMAEAIVEGVITYEPSARRLAAHVRDFVRPWGGRPAYVWAVGPPVLSGAKRGGREASQLVLAGA